LEALTKTEKKKHHGKELASLAGMLVQCPDGGAGGS
jgi:hypothetical protein